jgi:hypothetical protein
MTEIRAEPEQVFRCAIVLEPREPFHRWFNSLDPDGPPFAAYQDDEGEAIYLVPEMETPATTLAIVDEHYEYFFVSALSAQCTDFSKWPRRRTRRMFDEWFAVRLHSLVFDVDPSPLRHG